MNRPVLALGDSGADVETLQRYLSWLGYHTSGVTRRYDGGTLDAVRTFQRDHGLAPTGVADQHLWDRLEHGTPEPSQSMPCIASAQWASFEGTTLTYMARNIGGGPTRATRDELRLHLSGENTNSEPLLFAEFTVGEVPAESTYLGHFQLGSLLDGDYQAVIRLDVERHDGTPDATTIERSMDFTLRVSGGSPSFLAWS